MKHAFALWAAVLAVMLLAVCAAAEGDPQPLGAPEGYHLVWADEFDGDSLDPANWRFETHEPGWVNAELQAYGVYNDCVQVKDGELVIQPIREEDSQGRASYRSGRVNTWGRCEVQYGWIEARLRVPQGQGFLPAFWMMPVNEYLYGQWPKCGEIDIMEVLGHATATNYGTLHFGEPHAQRQGTYTLESGDFATEYHVYALEWTPGEISWYVDGNKYYSTSDWYSATGSTERAYPAPFNQPFYVILNIAVGGNWPGNPDETTVFDDRASMHVDYVRVWQLDEYDENVTRPERVLEMREADASGSFVRNGDFAVEEDLSDGEDWSFLLFNGGVGEAAIRDGEIVITSTAAGSEEYSVQLVQPGMPMEQGCNYVFSFEARADEERTIKPAITAPDVNWIRYMNDTPIHLTPEWQTFTFDVAMTRRSDDNGRIEFNMGRQGSTATVHIRNVRLIKVEE